MCGSGTLLCEALLHYCRIPSASERINFGFQYLPDFQPDIWQKSLSDEIEHWIDLGQPDDKRIRKACGRSRQVIIYTYKNRSANIWWEQAQSKLARFDNLAVIHLKVTEQAALEKMAARNMQLQCTIQDGTIWLSDETQNVEIETVVWK